MRLRLYHHQDGARIAYRETGTGPAITLLHSLGLSHREWAPVVTALSARFRVVLPDLPLHGDSEDRPRHPYTPDWFADVIAGFCREVAGPRPLLAGHDVGAELALRAVTTGRIVPSRLVLMSNRLHRRAEFAGTRAAWRAACRLGALPGLDRLLSRGATLVFRPSVGERLSAQHNPAARDLIRHAFADVAGNGNRARSWAKFVHRWPIEPQRDLLDAYPQIDLPVLLLWAEEDPANPLVGAQEALDLLPDAQLRTLAGTGFLMAYDDPVGVARELIAFCG
jgi:pimeloyl-ACP methyl ester carboxylesterase